MTVLVITRDYDVTADAVVTELQRREVDVARFDLADFPARMEQVAYLSNSHSRWVGDLHGRYRDIDLSAVESVWYRKPSAFELTGMTATGQQWAAAEATNGFGGVLFSLPTTRWVNHPHRNAAAEYKPHQLSTARTCGFTVPDTLLTNSAEHARHFCDDHREQGVIYKPLRGGPDSPDEHGQLLTVRPRTVTAADIDATVASTTHLFQTRVHGYPVRMTVVGRQLFAVRIDTPPDHPALDWRTHPSADLTYTPIEVPDQIAESVHQLMHAFGLTYAAPDFIVGDEDGDWVFHGDLNPNGQWGWIAGHTGLPIAQALATELTRKDNHDHHRRDHSTTTPAPG